LAFHKFLLSVLETVQSKYKGQAAADASSYITLCFNGHASHGIDRKINNSNMMSFIVYIN
jgi:hypothetical protein